MYKMLVFFLSILTKLRDFLLTIFLSITLLTTFLSTTPTTFWFFFFGFFIELESFLLIDLAGFLSYSCFKKINLY